MICFLFILSSFVQTKPDTIAKLGIFLNNQVNPTMFNQRSQPIPKAVLNSLLDFKRRDEFDVKKANRRRVQLIHSPYFSQANLLFFKSDSGVVINYYLLENTDTFNWSVGPFLDVQQRFGIRTSIMWNRLMDSSSSYAMNGYYSSAQKGLNFEFADRYWQPQFSYKINFLYSQSDYQYNDIPETDRFTQRFSGSSAELAMHPDADQHFYLAVDINKIKLDDGVYSQSLSIPYEQYRFGYIYSSLDWSVFPFSGTEIEFEAATQIHVESAWYRSIYFRSRQLCRLLPKFISSSEIMSHNYFSSAPLFFRLHLDGKAAHLGLRNNELAGDNIVIFRQSFRYTGNVDIRPEGFSTPEYAFGTSLSAGKLWDHNQAVSERNWYWNAAVDFYLFMNTSTYRLSFNFDSFHNFFLDMELGIL